MNRISFSLYPDLNGCEAGRPVSDLPLIHTTIGAVADRHLFFSTLEIGRRRGRISSIDPQDRPPST
jgi:hypothetical protein